MTGAGGRDDRSAGPVARRRWSGPPVDRVDDDAQPALFIAVPLATDAAAAVADLVGRVRARHLGGREVRWVRLDGLHLTLRFLGPTDRDRIPDLAAAVDAVAAAGRPFAVELAGTGSFPERGRPRVLWLGIEDGASRLGDLAAAIDAALVTRGWPATDRPFRAHLTLARADGVPAGPATTDLLGAELGDATITGPVDRLVLYRSRTGGGPARYEPLHVAPLGAGEPAEAIREGSTDVGSAPDDGSPTGASIAPSARPGLPAMPGRKEPQLAS